MTMWKQFMYALVNWLNNKQWLLSLSLSLSTNVIDKTIQIIDMLKYIKYYFFIIMCCVIKKMCINLDY